MPWMDDGLFWLRLFLFLINKVGLDAIVLSRRGCEDGGQVGWWVGGRVGGKMLEENKRVSFHSW